MTSPTGAHLHPTYGIDPSLRLGHRQGSPRPARGQRAHLGPLACVRPVSTRSALAPQVPQSQLTRPVPPGAVPGGDERGHSALSARTGTEPRERTNATKNAPDPAGATKPSLKPSGELTLRSPPPKAPCAQARHRIAQSSSRDRPRARRRWRTTANWWNLINHLGSSDR